MQHLPAVVVHERRGTWARQLRPRLAGWPIRWSETRSAADLEGALAGTPYPILVLDLADRPRAGLEHLCGAALVAPRALTLVLDPGAGDGVALLARELGATHVLSGVVPPPAVAAWVARWLPLARRRAEAEGWTPRRRPRPLPEPRPALIRTPPRRPPHRGVHPLWLEVSYPTCSARRAPHRPSRTCWPP